VSLLRPLCLALLGAALFVLATTAPAQQTNQQTMGMQCDNHFQRKWPDPELHQHEPQDPFKDTDTASSFEASRDLSSG
jgi:hypothetical protein